MSDDPHRPYSTEELQALKENGFNPAYLAHVHQASRLVASCLSLLDWNERLMAANKRLAEATQPAATPEPDSARPAPKGWCWVATEDEFYLVKRERAQQGIPHRLGFGELIDLTLRGATFFESAKSSRTVSCSEIPGHLPQTYVTRETLYWAEKLAFEHDLLTHEEWTSIPPYYFLADADELIWKRGEGEDYLVNSLDYGEDIVHRIASISWETGHWKVWAWADAPTPTHEGSGQVWTPGGRWSWFRSARVEVHQILNDTLPDFVISSIKGA